MANRLFDAPDAVDVEYGDGPWTVGFDLQAARAAVTLQIQNPCTEAGVFVAGAADASAPKTYTIQAFAATVSARRNLRCTLDIELPMITDLMEAGGAVSAAEYGLWNGVPGWNSSLQPSLQNSDVVTVGSGTTVADTLGIIISRYSTLTVLKDYIIHLGVDAAIDLSALGYTETVDADGQLRLRATGAPIVVSPYYPPDGVALTGPVGVKVGDLAAIQQFDPHLNRTNIIAYQLIAVAFDPSTAVRAT